MEVVDVTGSTNADLVRAAHDGQRGPRVLAARSQTAGRGRLGRRWQSPPGASLAVSVLWAPAVPQAAWTWLPMLVGLAVLDAAGALGARVGTAPGGVALKWPNDVVVLDGAPPVPDEQGPGARAGLAKLAGILSEVVAGAGGPVVVLGAGLNLADPDPPPPGARTASLAGLLGRTPAVEEVLPVLVAALEQRAGRWQAAGGDPVACGLVEDYRALCTTLGRRVRASTPGGTRAGLAVDLDPDGSLVLEPDGPGGPGPRTRVSAGDVEHVR